MFSFSSFDDFKKNLFSTATSVEKSPQELIEEERKIKREKIIREREEEIKSGRLVSEFVKLWNAQRFIEAIALYNNSSALNTINLIQQLPDGTSEEQPFEIKLIFFNLMSYYLNKNDKQKAYEFLCKFEPIKETPIGSLAFGVYLFSLPKANQTHAAEFLTAAIKSGEPKIAKTVKTNKEMTDSKRIAREKEAEEEIEALESGEEEHIPQKPNTGVSSNKKNKLSPENNEIRYYALLYRAHLFLQYEALEPQATEDFSSLLSYGKILPQKRAVYYYALAMLNRLQPCILSTEQQGELTKFLAGEEEIKKVKKIAVQVEKSKEVQSGEKEESSTLTSVIMEDEIIVINELGEQVEKLTILKPDELVKESQEHLPLTQEEETLIALARNSSESINAFLQKQSVDGADPNIPLYVQPYMLALFDRSDYEVVEGSLKNSDAIKDQMISMMDRCATQRVRENYQLHAIIPNRNLISRILYYKNSLVGLQPAVDRENGRLYKIVQALEKSIAATIMSGKPVEFNANDLVNIQRTSENLKFLEALKSVSPLLSTYFVSNSDSVTRSRLAQQVVPSRAQYGIAAFNRIKQQVLPPTKLLTTVHLPVKSHDYSATEVEEMIDSLTGEVQDDPTNASKWYDLALGYYYASLQNKLSYSKQRKYLLRTIDLCDRASRIRYADINTLYTLRDRIYIRLADLIYRKINFTSQQNIPGTSLKILMRAPVPLADFNEVMHLAKMPSYDRAAQAYGLYIEACVLSCYPDAYLSLDIQIELLNKAIEAYPHPNPNPLFLYTLSALQLMKGISSSVNVEGIIPSDTVEIRRAVIEHHLPSPHLRAIFEMKWGGDTTEHCLQYLADIKNLNPIYIDPLFEALLAAKVNSNKPLDFKRNYVDLLLDLISRIRNPALKIEALVQALSNGESHLLGKFFHPDGWRSHSVKEGDYYLSKVIKLLVAEVKMLRDTIEGRMVTSWYLSERLKGIGNTVHNQLREEISERLITTLKRDKFLIGELENHDKETYQWLRKITGLNPAAVLVSRRSVSSLKLFKPASDIMGEVSIKPKGEINGEQVAASPSSSSNPSSP